MRLAGVALAVIDIGVGSTMNDRFRLFFFDDAKNFVAIRNVTILTANGANFAALRERDTHELRSEDPPRSSDQKPHKKRITPPRATDSFPCVGNLVRVRIKSIHFIWIVNQVRAVNDNRLAGSQTFEAVPQHRRNDE